MTKMNVVQNIFCDPQKKRFLHLFYLWVNYSTEGSVDRGQIFIKCIEMP